jgi:hypothetical protein
MSVSPRRRGVAHLVFVVLLTGARAHAADLAALLLAVEANDRFDVPAMAELRIDAPGTPTPATSLSLYGRRGVVRLETANGWRALAKASKLVMAAAGQSPRLAREGGVPGSVLFVADFAPFAATALRIPQISDDGPLGVVVTGEPRPPSPYVLAVRTIAQDRPVVTAAKDYRWEINHLVKMSRVREWTNLDGHVRPRVVEVQDIASGKTTTLTFTWRPRPDLPAALFTPRGLAAPVPAS